MKEKNEATNCTNRKIEKEGRKKGRKRKGMKDRWKGESKEREGNRHESGQSCSSNYQETRNTSKTKAC